MHYRVTLHQSQYTLDQHRLTVVTTVIYNGTVESEETQVVMSALASWLILSDAEIDAGKGGARTPVAETNAGRANNNTL